MYLTEDKLHETALYARGGLRDCLRMIELHGRDRARAFLNPGIVVTAVSTWERFIVDVCLASEDPGWRVQETGWDRKYDGSVPWPWLGAGEGKDETRVPVQRVDKVLRENGVLASPLTPSWKLHVATTWWGADPTGWHWAEYSAAPADQNRDVIRRAILGARSARHAAAHRIYYKMAVEARGYRAIKENGQRDRPPQVRVGVADEEMAHKDWCYVWQSDNTSKAGRARPGKADPEDKRDPEDEPGPEAKPDKEDPYPGRPTIQHGYARGVVALFIQLADITIERIRDEQGWTARDSQLPAGVVRQNRARRSAMCGHDAVVRRGAFSLTGPRPACG